MTVTSGLSCLASSTRSGPLGACLRTLLGTSAWGSTVCGLTWKLRATPCNRSLLQLAPSVPRTDATESGFWPTPKATASGPDFARVQRPGSGGHDLATAVTALWPTPLAGDATGSRSSKGSRRPGEGGLRRMASEVALWPTPRASDGEKGSPNQAYRNGTPTLTALAQPVPVLWATPTARDFRFPNSPESQARRNAGKARGQQLVNEVAHLGPGRNGSCAGTAGSGPLHPEFLCWLMGFPSGWAKRRLTETP